MPKDVLKSKSKVEKSGFFRKNIYEFLEKEGLEVTEKRHKKLKKLLVAYADNQAQIYKNQIIDMTEARRRKQERKQKASNPRKIGKNYSVKNPIKPKAEVSRKEYLPEV